MNHRRSRPLAVVGSLVASLAAACVPELETDLSRIDQPTLLAIVAEPPEVEEGDTVALSALVAGLGEGSADPITYSFCRARKPLSELGPVDPACLVSTSADVIDVLGTGPAVTGLIEREACSAFGPRRPVSAPGQPAGRAVDADPTGGFYQPVLAELPGRGRVLGGVRLNCGLPGANRDQVVLYNERHRPNVNPRLERVEAQLDGAWIELGAATGATNPVGPGTEVLLRAGWIDCAQDTACTGAETYVRFDPELGRLTDETESLFVTWYATAGELESHRVAPTDPGLSSVENRWIAPDEAGPVELWAVLRDGRGGVGFAAHRLQVR